MKDIFFISGLPRSGSSLISCILKQNPELHSQTVSPLAEIIRKMNYSWFNFHANTKKDDLEAKQRTLKSLIDGYYKDIDKIVIDRDLEWIPSLTLLENILNKKVKMIVCVRNPAEIVASFEKLRKENPLFLFDVDKKLQSESNVFTRSVFYTGPDGVLGQTHKHLHDAITMNYIDRLLFVDYNKFCNTPKAQIKRIYEFLNLEPFEHDFENIIQDETLINSAGEIPNAHIPKRELKKSTYNAVQYLGLELFQQYNKEIFWTAWI